MEASDIISAVYAIILCGPMVWLEVEHWSNKRGRQAPGGWIMDNKQRRQAYYERLDQWILHNPEKWAMLNDWRRYRALLKAKREHK